MEALLKNKTCNNDSNVVIPSNINASTVEKDIHIKDVFFHLNKISIKKKNKSKIQRSANDNCNGFNRENNTNNKNRKHYKLGGKSGDNIFNNNHKKIIISDKVDGFQRKNRTIHKEYITKTLSTISHKENSFHHINVNRNVNLMNKMDFKMKHNKQKSNHL